MNLFALILLSAAALMNAYIAWRTAGAWPLAGRVPGLAVWLVFLVMWLVQVAGWLYSRGHHGPLGVGLEFAGMAWLGMVFLLLCLLLAVDVVTLFGWLAPRLAPVLRGLAVAAGLVLAGVGLYQGLRAPVVHGYEVKMPGLPPELDGATVVLASDLHLGLQRDEAWLNARVAQINALEPDLVFLVGDIYEGFLDYTDGFAAQMRRLRARLGAYAVLGNHEFFGSVQRSRRLLEAGGLVVLRNRWTEARPGLVIAGVDDLTTLRRRGDSGGAAYVAKALAGRPAGAATILLSHTPWQAAQAAADGVGLMLCGHTHGGQIWPFNYLVRQIYPYMQGRRQVDGMTLIVCRGTGLWGPPMRLWRPGEIIRVVLRAPRAKPTQ